MTDHTARHALPTLQAGQAQKEITHNEALALIDLTLQASVVAAGANEPPAAPAPGACWVVGPTPTGVWAGQAGALAGWTDGGWRFIRPTEGMTAWDAGNGMALRYRQGNWGAGELTGARLVLGGRQVVGERRPPIAAPSGGTTVDAEARVTLAEVIAALRGHGLIDG